MFTSVNWDPKTLESWPIPFCWAQIRLTVPHPVMPGLAWLWPNACCPVLGFVWLWLCAGGLACCLLCGGLRDEDQYLLRHSSLALDQDSPCGQHMLLAHLEHQNKEQLQCTLARLENENRSASKTEQRRACRACGAAGFVPAGIFVLYEKKK